MGGCLSCAHGTSRETSEAEGVRDGTRAGPETVARDEGSAVTANVGSNRHQKLSSQKKDLNSGVDMKNGNGSVVSESDTVSTVSKSTLVGEDRAHDARKTANQSVEISRGHLQQQQQQQQQQETHHHVPTHESSGSQPIPRKYKIVRKLGQGNYSKVYLAHMEDGREVAVKAITKAKLRRSELEKIHKETTILSQLQHPHIITYIEHFEDDQRIYIVTEYARGGELFEKIVEKEFYAENDVKDIMLKLLKTVKFCHERGIVHRDIKPENILLASKDDDSEIMLCDFGFAKKLDEEQVTELQTACGTPGYVAPEVISRQPYGAACDVWSLGVVAYILLCGYPPFRADNKKQLFQRIRNAEFKFDQEWWSQISQEAKDFVSSMLVANPTKRATLDDLLQHPFIQSREDRDITPSLEQLRKYNAKRKVSLLKNTWQAAVRFKTFGSMRGKGLSDDVNQLKEEHEVGGKDISSPSPVSATATHENGNEEVVEGSPTSAKEGSASAEKIEDQINLQIS